MAKDKKTRQNARASAQAYGVHKRLTFRVGKKKYGDRILNSCVGPFILPRGGKKGNKNYMRRYIYKPKKTKCVRNRKPKASKKDGLSAAANAIADM